MKYCSFQPTLRPSSAEEAVWADAARGETGSKGGGGPVKDRDLKDFTMERSIAEGKELEKKTRKSKRGKQVVNRLSKY